MKGIFFAILISALQVMGAMAQNTASVLRAIENSELVQLKNGLRIQVVTTKEYKYCNCRLSADVSQIGEGAKTGIKQVVAAMVGGDLIANEVIVKNLISHNQAMDSLMQFLSEVMYGDNALYVNFDEYKRKRVEYLRSSGRMLSLAASREIGLTEMNAEGLNSIYKDDFYDFRKQCFSPEKCLITVVSDMKASDIVPLAEKYFGNAARVAPRIKASATSIKPRDEIHLIPADSASKTFDAVYKHYYTCDKTPKNYMLNTLAYYMMYGNYLGKTEQLSCFKYDVNTVSISSGNPEFETFCHAVYEPRNPAFKSMPALNAAKKSVTTQFKERLMMPDFAAELAGNLVLYNFPKNFFTTFEHSINSVTTAEAQEFINNITQKGSSMLIVQGSHKALHCALVEQAAARDIVIKGPDQSGTSEIRINKGFGAATIINDYMEASGLSNAPKNMEAKFSSTYSYMDGGSYKAAGRILRKAPNMYMLENYILHDSTPLLHYREMFDGAVGVDSTMLYGMFDADPTRTQVLRQKATYPQEASYEKLGMSTRHHCSYSDFSKGLLRVDVTEASGHIYHDYYSISTKLRTYTEIVDHLGRIEKTIQYEYVPIGKYMLPGRITEKDGKLTITVIFDSYDLDTSRKKSEFQAIAPKK
ncbi:MAG: insulinase family protein [Bacteroidales bacterium]|nr:insulinase family protein [Bacteroidales bacterium]